MARSKYRQERTFVRGLRRLPSQDRRSFKDNVNRLRSHFSKFNRDVSELAQWLMSLRKNSANSVSDTRPFWEFILKPENYINSDESTLDWRRLEIFEVGVGLDKIENLSDYALPQTLIDSICASASRQQSQTAAAVIARLRLLSRPHRMILVKATAEFVMAKYEHGMENWKRQREEWEKEKEKWESEHTDLTEEIRGKYSQMFRDLGITIKRPRVCSLVDLMKNSDNCKYAGVRIKCGETWVGHSPLCKKYKDFLKKLRGSAQKYFITNAEKYLEIRRKNPQLGKEDALQKLFSNTPRAKVWFPKTWNEYLKALDIKEETIHSDYNSRLPHCIKIDGNTECVFNSHTVECLNYKKELLKDSNKPIAVPELEELYREWRRDYLAGPKKPSLRYPSDKTIPIPKIFGRGYYEIDFDTSVLRLRLDDMPENQFIEYGFKPWPADYDIQPQNITITSVNIHFIGTRARVGFRFEVNHKSSRFQIAQDEIDQLRSRTYPRASQDEQFIMHARDLLLNNSSAKDEGALRLLAVDLGSDGGAACLFAGRKPAEYWPLNIIKIEKLYDSWKMGGAVAAGGSPSKKSNVSKEKGLSKDHVGRHLDSLADARKKISGKRIELAKSKPRREPLESNVDLNRPLGSYDERRLTLHIRWMIRDWVRLNASQIIKIAESKNVDLIVFESMRGFRAPGYDKLDRDKKRRLAWFAFGQIRRKVTEKAVERGMRVVTVPYKSSSKICAECGSPGTKNVGRRTFKCDDPKCNNNKNQPNSDFNAAAVIGRIFWGDITLPS